MADLNKLLTPLFLNEGEIRKIIELLFFSYRDFTEGPDKVLEKINFGRAHHRVIYFVGKQKNLTIKELSYISKISERIINSIENNNKNVRPEYPFIRSILIKLEECLVLKKNTLLNLAVNERKILKKEGKDFMF